jgi:glucokinase
VRLAVETFATTEFPGLPAIIDAFLATQPLVPRIEAAAFGVAGPVINQVAQMTNVAWRVDAAELVARFGFTQVRLLNDLEAMAYSVPVLEGSELATLQRGSTRGDGNMGIIAAGTGLGGALLHRLGDGLLPVPSEIGHSDFPARTDREIELVRFIRARDGRCEIEHVLCGPGLVNLAQFTHQQTPCLAMTHSHIPAEVSRQAIAGTCASCVEALDMFIDAYGAVAGNLALIGVTTGGLFVGGGIAPRLLPVMANGRFMAAFRNKPPMDSLLEAMPVHVILNADAGLIGAAVYANNRWRNSSAF